MRPQSGGGLVFTVDFITPIVDDPYTFGAIAAANALSDVYAMGGEPQVALAIAGFPSDKLPQEVLTAIFRGGRDKAAEAGCAIVGGHTIIDAELKYGLCVIGSVDPARALSHTHGKPGDLLVLTKPLGFGIASQAIKKDRLSEVELELVCRLMTTLNKGAKDAALTAGAHAATDITGFGLLGHLHHLLLGSKCAARVWVSELPLLDFARPLAAEGLIPGGSKRNLEYVEPHCTWDPPIGEIDRLLCGDAQTSGGLLIAVPRKNVDLLCAELRRLQTPAGAIVGELIPGSPGSMEILPHG